MASMPAREFNQNTGRAKLMAREEPLFITERGSVQYVLLTIDDYNEIKGSKRTLADLAMHGSTAHYDSVFEDFIPARDEWSTREVDLS